MSKEEAIKAAISRLNGAQKWLGRREIGELPNIMWEDELPEMIIQGMYKSGNGILVATNKRLVFVDKGLMWGLKVEDFPYDRISSIEYSTGLLFGELKIYTSGNQSKIEQVVKDQVRGFAEFVRARMTSVSEHKSMPAAPKTQVAAENDIMSQLEKLAAMKTQGFIDDQEFKMAKAKLLGT